MTDEFTGVVSEYKQVVTKEHLDDYNHVNNAKYLEFLEAARWFHYKEKANSFITQKLMFVIVNININYRYQALEGDELIIKTQLKKIGSKSAVIHQEAFIKDTDRLVVDADVTFVIFDPISKSALDLKGDIFEALAV